MGKYINGVCVFIDILGTNSEKEFDKKYHIHRMFHEEMKIHGSKNNEHTAYDKIIFSFSDCAYIFYRHKENIDESRESYDKLARVALANTSLHMLKFYMNGFLVRGGVCSGEFYIDDLGFFGPAVERSYYIESKLAKNPMVMIDEDMAEKIYSSDVADKTYQKIVRRSRGKYVLNEFYYLEASEKLCLEVDIITAGMIITRLRAIVNSYDQSKISKNIARKLNYMKRLIDDKTDLALASIDDAVDDIIENGALHGLDEKNILKYIESEIGCSIFEIISPDQWTFILEKIQISRSLFIIKP